MNEYNIVQEYLMKIDKLDSSIYNRLVLKYGESTVNSVLDSLIEEDENALKYEYYLSLLNVSDNIPYTDSVKTYIQSFSGVKFLSADENKVLLDEVYNLVKKLETMVLTIEGAVMEKKDGVWVTDMVEYAIKKCNNKEKLVYLKEVYELFLEKRNRIVEGNLRLVLYSAYKFNNCENYLAEYIQFGNIGLMRAIEKYDPKFETAFSTYAYFWIRQYINRGMPSVMYGYKIPAHRIEENNMLIKAESTLRQQLGYEPSNVEIAEYLNIPLKKVEEVRELFSGVISLNAEIRPEAPDGDNDTTLIDFLADSDADVCEEVINNCLKNELVQVMKAYLTDREIYVLIRRFGLDGSEPATLEEVGNSLGITRERVRQCEAKAKLKLRRKGNKKLVGYYE